VVVLTANACCSSREARKSDQLRLSPQFTFTCKSQERTQSRANTLHRSLILSLWISTTSTLQTLTKSSLLSHKPNTTTNTTTMDDHTAPTTPGTEAPSFTPNETKLICAIMQNLTAEIQVNHEPISLQTSQSKPPSGT
jgi:hypothetical protein